jgi:hypothetical protein
VHVQRVVLLERNVDRAVTALADHVEAVVEELSEQGEEAVEGGRVAQVGGHVWKHYVAVIHDDVVLGQLGVQSRLSGHNGSGAFAVRLLRLGESLLGSSYLGIGRLQLRLGLRSHLAGSLGGRLSIGCD